jgi:hypothetical protein
MSKSKDVFSTKDKEVIVALVELLSSKSVRGLTEEEQAYFDEMIKELYEKRGLSPVS